MSRRCLTLALAALPALLATGRAAEPPRLPDALALQQAVQQVIERAEPSVVCVLVSRSDGYGVFGAAPPADSLGKLGKFDSSRYLGGSEQDEKRRKQIIALDLSHPDHQPEAYGSGVVVDAAGLILTNAHVVRGATKLYVRLPGGRGSYADVYASDPRSDLAVLKLIDRVPDLKPLALGDGGKVRKGQFVVALANPFAAGFRDGSPSASLGIVSNLRRRTPGPVNELDRARQTLHHYGTLIQTDARIALGCSGGALLNLDGELIALTTAQAALVGSETPGGFAVPLDAGMKRILEVLVRGEEVEYGFLGVHLQQGARPGRGVPVASVADGSPAQRAGLQGGDTILTVAGQPVRENDDLFLHIGTQLAGSSVRLEVAPRSPGAPTRTYTVKLAKYYIPGQVIASKKPPAVAGLRVDYTSLISQWPTIPLGYRGIPDGVLIREVLPGSAAEKARLQPDKVITHVNGGAVRTPEEFYRAMASAGGSVKITLLTGDGREEITLGK